MSDSSAQHVLHFIESEGVYGAESVILNLSQQMQQQSHVVPIVGCIVQYQEDDSALFNAAVALGIKAVKIPIRNSMIPVDIIKASRQLRPYNIRLIHAHGYKPSVFGFLLSKILGITIISTCHLWFDPKNGPLKMRVMIRLEKFFYRWFPKIIGVSDPIREILINSGIPSDKVLLVRNGVDFPEVELNDAEKKSLRQSLGLNENTCCILNTGRLTRQKSQATLIEAAQILKEKNIDAKILIVGEGELKTELIEKITLHNLSDYVSLLGFREDIDQLLLITDIFALPSLDEGMPMSLLEAAAARKAIITTDVGDISKLIQHQHSGIIIATESPQQLADAAITLMNDKQYAAQLADNAFAIMSQYYSSAAMCKSYLLIYDNLLSPSK